MRLSIRHFVHALAIAAAVASAFVLAVQAQAQTTRPIGVWYQPASSFAKWHNDRLFNTLVGYEWEGGATSADTWCKAAKAAQLDYWLQSTPATDPHLNDASCKAVIVDPDEANGGGNVPADRLFARSMVLKGKAPGKPLFVNLDGWKLQWMTDADLWAYLQCGDWIGADWHVVNRGEGIATWDVLLKQVDRIRRLAPGKRLFVFIECSDQLIKLQDWLHIPANQPQGELQAARCRAPTAAEMAYEDRSARARGCEVIYFPHVIGKSWLGFDGMTADLVGGAVVLNGQP